MTALAMRPLRIGIAGAGLLGRLLAFTLARAGHRVEVHDPAAGPEARGAAGWTAAGMLSPLAELESADERVFQWGLRSIDLWPQILAALPAPDAAATVLADYRSQGLSLTQHPVALLREQLAAFKVQPAAVLQGYPQGRLARASGIVTHRQRPETARGVVFVTLEDDTGSINVIVWPQVVETQRRALLGASLLTVYGIWQCHGEPGYEVRHLVAKTLIDHTPLLQGLATSSRNFR